MGRLNTINPTIRIKIVIDVSCNYNDHAGEDEFYVTSCTLQLFSWVTS